MAKGMRIQPSASNPLGAGQRGIWVNSSNDLVYEDSVAPVNVTQKISDLGSGTSISGISKLYTNNSGVTIPAYSPVYISAAGEITMAINTADFSSRVIGITTQAINHGATGFVQLTGYLSNVFFSSFTVGDHVYLDSVAGQMTSVEPSTPGQYIVIIGIADDNTFILQPSFMRIIT